MGSARINAIRQRLAEEFDVTKDLESDLDWDDIFIRSGEINFEKDWEASDQRETEWKWNYEEEYPSTPGKGRHPDLLRGIEMDDEGNEYWIDKSGKRRKTEGSYVDVGPSDKRLYEHRKYDGVPQLQDSFLRKGLVPSKRKFPNFDQGIEGLKGSDYGFMSPKGMWFGASTIMDENERNDFDELGGTDALAEWLNKAKEAGLINEQTVEKYSREDGVPLDRINIYSKASLYLFLCGIPPLVLLYIITSNTLNPHS